ncbi:MAG: hypothetical protein WKF58_08885 [Ilumatobacteraceae bacterium]
MTTDRGDEVSAQFVVTAVGCLSTTKQPEMPGLDRFGGRTYHTGRWPHEGVDFTGQRVGVIGTGSSAHPVDPDHRPAGAAPHRVPAHAELQRCRRATRRSNPSSIGERKARYAEHRRVGEARASGVVNAVTEDLRPGVVTRRARARATDEGWEQGTPSGCSSTYTDLSTDKAANDTVAEFVRERDPRHRSTIPAVAETLAPRDHAFGTKRPCLDTGLLRHLQP